MPDPLTVLERDVSATPAEYAHGLRLAYPEGVTGGPMSFTVTNGKAALEIELTHGPERRIALLRLPTLKVRMTFTAGSQAERQEMLHRMDLAMRRGGG